MTSFAGTGEFSGFISAEDAAPIFDEVNKTSIVQQLAREIPMGPTGVAIPFWDGEVTAEWVGEGARKPVTKGSLNKLTIQPHKIATIFAASAEVVRLNPGRYLTIMRGKVAEAIAVAFDQAVLYGTLSPFGAFINQTTKEVSLADEDLVTAGVQGTAYGSLNEGLRLLVDGNKRWTGTLLDNVAEPILNASSDTLGRPLLLDAPYTDTNVAFRAGRVLGRPTFIADNVVADVGDPVTHRVVGFMGDFREVVYGRVGGISYDISDQASIDFTGSGDYISLWQHNLVAVRVEAEFGVLVRDPEDFVRLTDETN